MLICSVMFCLFSFLHVSLHHGVEVDKFLLSFFYTCALDFNQGAKVTVNISYS